MLWWRQLEERWNKLQVGRQGSYSVERAESLNHYCESTSLYRVALVCILTPIPALTVAVLLECMPLRSPSQGWAASWVFWVRLALMQWIATFAGVSQLVVFIPGLRFSFNQRVVVASGVAVGFVGTCLFEAITVGFPVPLVIQAGAAPVTIFVLVMFRLVLGRDCFERQSRHFKHIQRFNRFFVVYMAMFGIYPLYKVLYDLVPTRYQYVVVVVLPIWRFAGKQFVLRATRELEDLMPELIAFSVDFYSTLFIAVCMYTSSSIYLSALFIAVDAVQTLLELREVSAYTDLLLQLVQSRRTSLHLSEGKDSCHLSPTTLLPIILEVTRSPRAFTVTSFEEVRLRACVPQPLTTAQVAQLQLLEASGVYIRSDVVSTIGWNSHSYSNHRRGLGFSNQVVPVTPGLALSSNVAVFSAGNSYHTDDTRVERSKKQIQQGLQLLFHCEYLALVEYIECIVPLLFLAYKAVLVQLPNVAYYPGGAEAWGMDAVANILGLAMLEIVSLLVFDRILQRKFAFSPLYQLAYVLETEVYLVQGKLFIEVLILLQYEVQHLGRFCVDFGTQGFTHKLKTYNLFVDLVTGADFTLRFEWLHDNHERSG